MQRQLLDNRLAVAAVLNAVKHAGKHLGCVGDGFLFADLAAGGVQIGRTHAEIVGGNLKRAAGAGGGLFKNQRNIFAAQRVMGDAGLLFSLQLGCQLQQAADLCGGKVQQCQKIMPYEVHIHSPFKNSLIVHKYTYIIAHYPRICKRSFL